MSFDNLLERIREDVITWRDETTPQLSTSRDTRGTGIFYANASHKKRR